MSEAEIWIGYWVPAMGVGLGLIGLAVAWLQAKWFDRRFGAEPVETEGVRGRRPSPYRKPSSRPPLRKPRRGTAAKG